MLDVDGVDANMVLLIKFSMSFQHNHSQFISIWDIISILEEVMNRYQRGPSGNLKLSMKPCSEYTLGGQRKCVKASLFADSSL